MEVIFIFVINLEEKELNTNRDGMRNNKIYINIIEELSFEGYMWIKFTMDVK